MTDAMLRVNVPCGLDTVLAEAAERARWLTGAWGCVIAPATRRVPDPHLNLARLRNDPLGSLTLDARTGPPFTHLHGGPMQ